MRVSSNSCAEPEEFDGCKLSWQESAFTIDNAKAQVQRLGLSRPGEYLIFKS
jgi:hypothetical protein